MLVNLQRTIPQQSRTSLCAKRRVISTNTFFSLNHNSCHFEIFLTLMGKSADLNDRRTWPIWQHFMPGVQYLLTNYTYSKYLPTGPIYSAYIQCLHTVSTCRIYMQYLHTVLTNSTYIQYLPTVHTYSTYILYLPTIPTYSGYK